MSHNVQLRLRVVHDQNADHVLIRVRHRSRTSPRVSFSKCVAHGKAVVLQTILGLVLRLVGLIIISVLSLPLAPSDQFRTETTSLLTTILPLIVDSQRTPLRFSMNLELINVVLVHVHGRPIF